MKQTEALRIADYIKHWNPTDEVAIELLRQHAEIERLQDVNKDLLEALKRASGELYRASSYCNTYEVLGDVNEAIAKGEQA